MKYILNFLNHIFFVRKDAPAAEPKFWVAISLAILLFVATRTAVLILFAARHYDILISDPGRGCDGSGVALKISSETAEATDPGDRSFDNPSFRHDLEADCGVKPFDDLNFPGACSSSGCSRFWSLVAAVGKNAFDEGVQTAGAPTEHQCDAIAILNVSGMNSNAQQ